MIGGEIAIKNLETVEIKKFATFYTGWSELHFTTTDGERLLLVFDNKIDVLLEKALDNIREV